MQKIKIKKQIINFVIVPALVVILAFVLGAKNTNSVWLPKTFINKSFWNQNPNSGNIITALFGDQTDVNSSPYMRYREDLNCNVSENDIILVTSTNHNTLLNNMQKNKIYLLQSGNYNITNTISPKECSAIIGIGNVNLRKSNNITTMININEIANTIIDNLSIDGQNKVGTLIHIYNNSKNITVNNVQLYNGEYGIRIQNSNNNFINNVNAHDNLTAIFKLGGLNSYLNQSQIFNNNTGINIDAESFIINNSHIYNNQQSNLAQGDGISMSNSQIYNNNNFIFRGYSTNSIFLNNLNIILASLNNTTNWVYNNDGVTIAQNGGNLILFNNDNIVIEEDSFGYINSGAYNISNGWVSNPINSLGFKLLSGTNRINLRGVQTFVSHKPIKYVFGKNIPKQIQPVKHNDEINSWENFGIEGMERNSDDFIASIKMELNSEDENIVNYYYGINSEFIVNWHGNNCSLGAFTVEYISNQTEFNNKLLNPLGHTIYVLNENIYTIIGNNKINIQDDCIAIISKNENKTIKRNGATNDPLIKINGGENIILDGLNLDGNNQANYGLLLEKNGNHSSNNNTFNNIKAYNNKKDGIRLGLSSSYNTIMNTQTWNNQENGIEINYAGLYNIVNNSLSYNNTGYGIRFGNISKYNTINNSQFFNNNIGGIFADYTTEQNILNNIHSYNNKDFGLNIKRSSGNTLNNIYSYNNRIGINIQDTSSVNNKYNGQLFLFNNQEHLSGTNGIDNFLSAEGANSNLIREPGMLLYDATASCMRATNPRSIINTNIYWFFDTNSDCILNGKKNEWNSSNANEIEYLFGLGISKQIAPVGYNNGNINNLNNQYNSESYIGETNPIWWTHPGNMEIMSGQEQKLDLNIRHEMVVKYDSNRINHNFDIKLNHNFLGLDIHLEIQKNNMWHNVGVGEENIDFTEVQGIKVVLITPDSYYQTVSGTVYIGTQEYGNNIGLFEIRTRPNPTPPTITRSGNISLEAIWHGEANTWQAVVHGEYATTAIYSYVTGADDCTTGITGTIYNGNLINITETSNYNSLNNKYVCIVAKDNVNGEYTTGLSNQIKVSKIDFIDPINTNTPIYFDIIDINFQNIQNYGYKRITNSGTCNQSGMINTVWEEYSGPIVINNTSLNGKYICVYGKNNLGTSKYILSSNKLNLSSYSNVVRFIDDIESNWVSSDTIKVYFSGSIQFSHKKYKRVNSPVECSNTNNMIDYTADITIDDEELNGKYFCLYTRENGGTENYLISSNALKIDTTNPTQTSIIKPLNNQEIYWLVVETTGAIDEESGISHFEYQIAENMTFLDVITSGSSNSPSEIFSPIFNDVQERYYSIRVRAVDKVGNKGERSSPVEFKNKILNNFSFQNINNAQLGTAYVSNEIIMGGLGVNEIISAKVTNGILYRNGSSLGNSGLIQNNDKLTIEMISNLNYSGVAQTELRIANRNFPRKITTVQTGTSQGGNQSGSISGFNLTAQEMLMVQIVFNSTVSMYKNPSQLHSFLITMSSMLKDNIDLAGEGNAESLRYLLYLVQQYLAEHFSNQGTGNIHKAPNCKEYTITYDTGDNTYYSPNTVKQIRFGSRDELVKYLDVNNPGDCHINIYGNTISYNNTDPNRHIAPNGKVYNIQSNNLGYSSPEFVTVKYFASIAELRTFIDKNNPAIVVRDHTVDTTFDPITHTAPNGKSYKIYKTNRGYMSYKLMKVQYYGSLDELKNHIDKNNKK